MHTDCAFRIGRDHAICQDYGVARSGEATLVILADGCSSSPDTDLGARLLVRSAEVLWPDWILAPCGLPGVSEAVPGAVKEFHRQVVRMARGHAERLGLDRRCLDATLLILAVKNGRWLAMIYGDGTLAIGERGRDGAARVRVQSVSFSGGYPDYPSYLVDAERRVAFERVSNNRRCMDGWLLTSQGVVRADESGPGGFVDGCFVATGFTESLEWLAVLTDGASSFSVTDPRDRTSGRVPLPEVIGKLLAFKSLSGVFVQRRVQRFLKECELRGWQHHDDLGVGAVAMG